MTKTAGESVKNSSLEYLPYGAFKQWLYKFDRYLLALLLCNIDCFGGQFIAFAGVISFIVARRFSFRCE